MDSENKIKISDFITWFTLVCVPKLDRYAVRQQIIITKGRNRRK